MFKLILFCIFNCFIIYANGNDLINAVLHDDITSAKKLIEQKIDLNFQDSKGNTALHKAISRDNKKLITLLIEAGASLNIENNDGMTPIFEAANCGYKDTVILLINKGVNVNAKHSQNGYTILYWAVLGEFVDIIRLLLEKGADPRGKYSMDNIEETVLHRAVISGNYKICKMLIENGSEIDVQDKSGYTPLNRAVLVGHESIVGLLLKSGANLNIQNEIGNTPLHFAISKFSKFWSYSNNNHVWSLCSYLKYKNIINLLLKSGVNVNLFNNKGNTVLYEAVSLGNVTLIEQILKLGADVNAKNSKGCTALHNATESRSISSSTTSRWSHESKSYITSTTYSKAYPYDKIVNLILNYNPDINIEDDNGRTPLYNIIWLLEDKSLVKKILKECKYVEKEKDGILSGVTYNFRWCIYLVELLLDAGVNINSTDKGKDTALHCAVINNNISIVKLLLKYGARIDVENNSRKTALTVASNESSNLVFTIYQLEENLLDFKEQSEEVQNILVERWISTKNFTKLSVIKDNLSGFYKSWIEICLKLENSEITPQQISNILLGDDLLCKQAKEGYSNIFSMFTKYCEYLWGYKDFRKKAYKNLRTDLYKIHLLNANNKIPTEVASQIVLKY